MKKTLKLAAAAIMSAAAMNFMNITANAQTTGQGISEWSRRSQDEVNAQIKDVLADGSLRYEIQAGDTLSSIAQALNMSTKILAALNNINDPDLILAGTVLVFNAETQTVTIENAGQASVEITAETPVAPVAEVPVVEAVAEWVAPATTEAVASVATVEEWVPVAETTTPAATVAVDKEVAVAPAAATTPAVSQPATPAVTEAPVVETAPVAETPVVEEYVEPTYVAPAVEEAAPAPVAPAAPAAPAVDTSLPAHLQELAGYSENAGLSASELEAKYEIRRRESTHNYDVYSPSGKHYGAYQMLDTYFTQYGDGTRSVNSQEAASNGYVNERYGSWENALSAHNSKGWY